MLLQKSGIWLEEITVIPGSTCSLIVSLTFNHRPRQAQGSCRELGCCRLPKTLRAQRISSPPYTIGNTLVDGFWAMRRDWCSTWKSLARSAAHQHTPFSSTQRLRPNQARPTRRKKKGKTLSRELGILKFHCSLSQCRWGLQIFIFSEKTKTLLFI